MARHNPIGLASGVLPEFGPVEVVEAADAAGFDLVGLWIELANWTAETTRAVRRALAATALPLIDAEVLWIKPDSALDDHKRMLDIAAEIGAPNLLCVSSDPDASATAAKLAALCDRAQAAHMRIALEFGVFTSIKTLADARALLAMVDHPALAILIDPIHVDRSNTSIAAIAALPPDLLPYAQFCDAPAERPDPDDFDAVIIDAVDLRRQLGEGALPLDAMLDALPPALPLSIELRSRALRDAFPDAAARARSVAGATRAWLSG